MREAIELIKNAQSGVVFTGAGVSVESGIPPFTGAGGLWNKYDPKFIELDFFYQNPAKSWEEMKKIFFTCMGQARPNKAHEVIAQLEKTKKFQGVITQNIDGLHQAAGSKNVQEFHGTIHQMHCIQCARRYDTAQVDLTQNPPVCKCGGVLKPDFVFYGEGINPRVYSESETMAISADVAPYFEQKEYFPKQKILKKSAEDGLVVECFTGKYEEIMPTILAWIPHIVVQEPRELKDLVAEKIKAYSVKM